METDGLPPSRRFWAMATVAIIISMAVLDGVIANVALPSIARELQTTPARSIWVVNAYQLAIVVSLLPLASLGEILGYRRVYQAGVAVFTLASLGCALSRSMDMLVMARIAQGLGAAGIMSMNAAVIRFTVPRARLGRALGFNAVVIALASAMGPSIASAILAVGPWPWLFFLNVPLGVAALAIGHFALPHTERSPRKFDIVGAILNGLTFGGLIVGVEGMSQGEVAATPILLLAVGVAAGAALTYWSTSRTNPLVPLDLLRMPVFALSMATSSAAFTAQMFVFVSMPFILQYSLGRSVVETGLLMTPWSLALAAVAPISGRLADRYPAPILGSLGLGTLAVGLTFLAWMPLDASPVQIGWRMAICGAGFALFQSPNNRTMLTAAPPERAGSAGGMLATARLLGQTIGATLAALAFRMSSGAPEPRLLLVAAGFAVVAAGVSWLKVGQPHPRPMG